MFKIRISLRRRVLNVGTGLLPRDAAKQPQAAQREERVKVHDEGSAHFAIRLQYKGEVRTSELPLTQDVIAHLALEADFRNMRIGELIAKMIVAIAERDDLCQAVLQSRFPLRPCSPT